jgi:hypothetical protein
VEREEKVWEREEQNDIVKCFVITFKELRNLQLGVWLVEVE